MISLPTWRPPWATLLLALVLVWAPLPFASVTPGGLAALRIGTFLALVLTAVTRCGGDVKWRDWLPCATLVGIALVGLFQAIPLPGFVVGVLSPERLALETAAGSAGGGLPLSLAPSQSLSTALTFAAVAAALAAGRLLGGTGRSRRWLFGSILLGASFQLLYGFRHLAAGSSAVWGVEVARDPERLRGTFVNPAHLAPYLEMALAVTFALAWWSVRRARRAESPLERRLVATAGLVLLWLFLFAGLSFTRSRAGLVAALLATVAQGVVLAAYHRRWRLLPVGLAAVAAGVGLIAWTGLERGLGRLLGTSVYSVAASARLEVWEGTLELWRRFPWTGIGLGGFESAFPMVETPELGLVIWQHAHNDWLELLTTGGVVTASLAVLGVVGVAGGLHSALSSSRSQEAAAAALAGFGALVAVGFHELVDFGLTQPANALTLAVLLGAAMAGDAVVPEMAPKRTGSKELNASGSNRTRGLDPDGEAVGGP